MSDETADQTPEEIRADIDQTREELGDTVEALAAKTDVKAQAHDKVEQIKGNVRQQADDLKSKAQNATPSGAQQGGQAALDKAKQNPLPIAVGVALLFGFLIGRGRNR